MTSTCVIGFVFVNLEWIAGRSEAFCQRRRVLIADYGRSLCVEDVGCMDIGP
jgi:hypothetical protein